MQGRALYAIARAAERIVEYSILRTCGLDILGLDTAYRLPTPTENSWPSLTIITPGTRESWRVKRDSKRSSNVEPHARILGQRVGQRRQQMSRFCRRQPPATAGDRRGRLNDGRTSGAHRPDAS